MAAELECRACGGVGAQLYEEDGRMTGDICYHCMKTGLCQVGCVLCDPETVHAPHEASCRCDFCFPPRSYPCLHGDPCECSADWGDELGDEEQERIVAILYDDLDKQKDNEAALLARAFVSPDDDLPFD